MSHFSSLEFLCSEGFYGVACNETCGNCHDVKTCNYVNGTCLTGCDAGYWGSLCKTPCSHGFFGYDCSERCLDTCAGCNNVTGLCDSGCKPGWKGYFCNKGSVDKIIIFCANRIMLQRERSSFITALQLFSKFVLEIKAKNK